MNKTFISYSYNGTVKNDFTIYQGFGNTFLPYLPPKDEEELEVLTDLVNQKAKVDLGMETIACTLLFFRKDGI